MAGPGPLGTPGAWAASSAPKTTPAPAGGSGPRAYDVLAPRRAGRPSFARIGARLQAEARWLERARAAMAEFYTGAKPRDEGEGGQQRPPAHPVGAPTEAPGSGDRARAQGGGDGEGAPTSGTPPADLPAPTPIAYPFPYDLGHGLDDEQARRRRQRPPILARARRLKPPSTSWAAALVLAFAVGIWAGGAAFSQPSAASTGTTPTSPAVPAPVRLIRSVPTTAKAIALTFDDGPSPKYTPMILQLLQENGAHATFFVIGQEVERYPQILKAEVDGGNEVGNHGYHHLTLQNVSTDQLVSEVQTAEQTLVSLTGSQPTLYRLPGGKSDP
ncbi:MAG TPA: polysaccharide deacetylase family protein, partial [Bacillota bacterium]|nr:polysaccharide deacetylase family protein [Bacillota bacterium]